jgi:4-amino-4-deoxy-L-arabinose transferase-like glycosyltransferase
MHFLPQATPGLRGFIEYHADTMTFPARKPLPLALWYAIALTLGLALRLWFVAHAARVDGDTLIYGDFARNWLQHGIYGFSRIVNGVQVIRPTLIRLPGYPLFLALCFRIFGVDQYSAVMVVQAFADLWTCTLLAGISGRLFGRHARIAALLLACLCPFTASYTADALTETLTLLCIAAAFYALLRWKQAGAAYNRWLYAIAVALAYAILLRPEQGLLAAAVVPAMIWIALETHPTHRVRALLPVLLASVLTLAPLVPWAIRNYRVFHVIQPLAPRLATDPGELMPLGFDRWYRTWGIDFATTESVYWKYDGDSILVSDLPTRAFDSDQQYDTTAKLLDDYNEHTSATPALEARFNQLADERIRANPLRYYLALPIARVVNMALRPRTDDMRIPNEWWHFTRTPGKSTFALLYAGLNLAYFILAGSGFRRWQQAGWSGSRPVAWSLAATILLRVALLLTIDNSEPRYTLEFFPVLIVFAAALWANQD